MQEELTAKMHAELLEGELSYQDTMILACKARLNAGDAKEEVFKKYGITEEEYNANIDRVMNTF